MKDYDIVAVLWEDHIQFSRTTFVNNPDKAILPSLSIGVLYKETKKTITIVSNFERYHEHDDVDYMVILKSTVLSVKKFGSIKLRKIRK